MTKRLYTILLSVLIIGYIAYFGTYSVLKYHHLYSEYFDLGLMHQSVYNSYQAIRTGDMSRVLELTDPHGTPNQIKRMAIHNDMILALLAPFYFIYAGPETILIIQTIVLALGAWAVFKIVQMKLKNEWAALALSFAYLMYSPMQHANIFEFHAVTFATTFILWMFYFWLREKYWFSLLFVILSLLTKEEVGLTLGMFGLYAAFNHSHKSAHRTGLAKVFPGVVTVLSWGWSLLSVFVIIPFFNNAQHFATGYYDHVLENVGKYIFSWDTAQYFFYLLGPLAFLTVAAPQFIIIAAPEVAINLLSNNMQLRSMEFHYVSAIQPWLFIGAVYGLTKVSRWGKTALKWASAVVVVCSLIFAYMSGPLPYTLAAKTDALIYNRPGDYAFTKTWADKLKDDTIKISATDQIAPFFTSRRYFYIFSENYQYADYVIISTGNLQYTYRKNEELPAYEALKKDPRFTKIYNRDGYEVYKKIWSTPSVRYHKSTL